MATMTWDQIKDAAPGYHTITTESLPADLVKSAHTVAWVSTDTGTRGGADPGIRGGALLQIIIKILPTLVKGIIAIIVLAITAGIVTTILKVNVTVSATNAAGKPTLLTDDRGNVYTISYDVDGNASIEDKVNPNDWMINVGIVIAVIVVALVGTYIMLRVLKPVAQAAATSPPRIGGVSPVPAPAPPASTLPSPDEVTG